MFAAATHLVLFTAATHHVLLAVATHHVFLAAATHHVLFATIYTHFLFAFRVPSFRGGDPGEGHTVPGVHLHRAGDQVQGFC